MMTGKTETKFNFTDHQLTKKDIIKDKRYFVFDLKTPGLRCCISPTGTKSFSYQRWSKKHGKPLTRTIGKYPAVSIIEAREKANQLSMQINKGVNIQLAKNEEKTNTVKEFSKIFMESKQDKRPNTIKLYQGTLDLDIIPQIGNYQIGEVQDHHIESVLTKKINDGFPAKAHTVYLVLSNFFNFCVKKKQIESHKNPMTSVDKPAAPEPRERTLNDAEMKLLWENLTDSPCHNLLKILLLTGQRINETRLMEFDQIKSENVNLSSDPDIDDWKEIPVWTIPKGNVKTKNTHKIPLPPLVRSIIKHIQDQARTEYVFPGRSGEQPVNPSTTTRFLQKFSKKQDIDVLGSHDLRRTVRTYLPKLRVDFIVSEKILNHRLKGMPAVYDLHDYLPEMYIALKKWEKYLTSNVISVDEESNG
ncbi:MAG: site-specific integrase [Desulfobacter sp.]|nr:MAG: site-specific integrase [Desulfobacter sp.]